MIQLDTKIKWNEQALVRSNLDFAGKKGSRSRLHQPQTQHQNPNNEVPQERCETSRGYSRWPMQKFKIQHNAWKPPMGTSAQLLEEEIKLEVKPPWALMLNNSTTTRCSITNA